MPDPIARKRLKKKMLDRWENEGGAIAADTTTADDTSLTSEDKGQGRNYLLSAITRRSARPHLRRRGPSLLGNKSGSKCRLQRPWRLGYVASQTLRACPDDHPRMLLGNPPRFIFVHLRLLHPPSFSSEDG